MDSARRKDIAHEAFLQIIAKTLIFPLVFSCSFISPSHSRFEKFHFIRLICGEMATHYQFLARCPCRIAERLRGRPRRLVEKISLGISLIIRPGYAAMKCKCQ